MITVNPLEIDGKFFTATSVELPKTNLLIISNDIGYIMCAALDVDIFNENEKLKKRNVIAGRAEGVRTIDELLHAPLAKITDASKEYGWQLGMTGKDALKKLT
ncbi:YunC family protein [Ornithinibacillus salinisoli]|uniref:YunC family protein n=1 Tax=Ornithinibacillus salinisoli TaxID=1848459 RepID=A0ABW4W300_9BACI